MPRPIKRFLQRVHMMWRSRRPVTRDEAARAVHPSVKKNYPRVQQSIGTPTSESITARAYQTISVRKNRFALMRAFRAAGIFGNETRNKIFHALNQSASLERIIRPEQARIFLRVLKEARRAADYEEGASAVEIEVARNNPTKEAQRPVHGNAGKVIQGDFSTKRKRVA